jgi:hypothetical protein
MDRQPSNVRPEESGEIDVKSRDQLDKSADQAPFKIARAAAINRRYWSGF